MADANEPQHCETLQDIVALSGKRVILIGRYRPIDIRMRPQSPPVYIGHAAILLNDGTEVLLEPSWSPAAIRSPKEQAEFDGKIVEVTGIVHHQSPQANEPVTQITGPAISRIELIRLGKQ